MESGHTQSRIPIHEADIAETGPGRIFLAENRDYRRQEGDPEKMGCLEGG